MNPTPAGWPRVSSSLYYRDAAAMIDWLCDAFGFEIRLKVEGEGGRIEHSELSFGPDGLVMVGSELAGPTRRHGTNKLSPLSAGGNTQGLMLYVDDVEAHHARALNHGARIVSELQVHDYGDDHWVDKGYGCHDPEGHLWWVAQRLRG